MNTDPCVHCGFCLPTCASYRVLGTEMDSPRGRIHALKAIEAGELELDATTASHFDSCLGCFACVSACPSGVRYDQLIEATRPQLNAPELRSPAQRAFRRLLFTLLPYPERLRTLLAPLRAYAGTPLQALARRSGLTRLFGPQLEAMEQLLPPLAADAFQDAAPLVQPAVGPRLRDEMQDRGDEERQHPEDREHHADPPEPDQAAHPAVRRQRERADREACFRSGGRRRLWVGCCHRVTVGCRNS